jgi:AcrR family transcriptional regulator
MTDRDTSAPPRPQRPSPARERILSTADRLFYNEGIHAVGINRVVEEAAGGRGSVYRHFPSKDDLIAAYLQRRAQYDRDQVGGLIARYPDDPRRVLTELATVLTADDFTAVSRGCPFINASAEFTGGHTARRHAREIRRWITGELEALLRRVDHRSPAATADQLMMIRTGAVVSGALDGNERLAEDFLAGWDKLIDDGLPSGT